MVSWTRRTSRTKSSSSTVTKQIFSMDFSFTLSGIMNKTNTEKYIIAVVTTPTITTTTTTTGTSNSITVVKQAFLTDASFTLRPFPFLTTFLHLAVAQRQPIRVDYKVLQLQSGHNGGGDSSVVRAPDSWLKGRGFESLLERRENFLLRGRLSVLTLISVSVPPPCYHSSTYKIPVILPKVQVAGYS